MEHQMIHHHLRFTNEKIKRLPTTTQPFKYDNKIIYSYLKTRVRTSRVVEFKSIMYNNYLSSWIF